MPALPKHQPSLEKLKQSPKAYAWYALALLTFVYVLNFLERSLIYILFTPNKFHSRPTQISPPIHLSIALNDQTGRFATVSFISERYPTSTNRFLYSPWHSTS